MSIRLTFIASFLLISVYSLSQNLKWGQDTFDLDSGTIYGTGQLLDEHKIGYWNYSYLNKKYSCRLYYLIDTNIVSLNKSAKNILNSYQTLIKLDSILVSYENYNIPFDSSHSIRVILFQPIIFYNIEGDVISEIVNDNGRFIRVEYQESGLLESSTEIENGFENGFQYIYDSKGKLVLLNYYSQGLSRFYIRNNYNKNGKLQSSTVEYDQQNTPEIKNIWPIEK